MAKSTSNGIADLSAIFCYILSKNADIRSISINLHDGTELISETRSDVSAADDGQLISIFTPSFSQSLGKTSLLGLGAVKYSLLWTSNIILLQSVMDSLIVSLSMEEGVNIALAEDALDTLRNILRPFSKFNPLSES